MNMAEPLRFQKLRGELRQHEPMGRHVSWRTGGRADRFYAPADLHDLAAFLRQLPDEEPLLFVGLGSNLLVRDGGWRGTAVLMHGASHRPELREDKIYAEAGVASPKVARFAAMNDLEGAEFLAGVPGTVGGALAMNAGCYGGETWDVVDHVATIDRRGRIIVRGRDEYDIGYRHCAPKTPGEEWFAAAWFRLKPGDGEMSRAVMKELLTRRIATQPLSLPNAGSVFRNPPKHHAAALERDLALGRFATQEHGDLAEVQASSPTMRTSVAR